MNERRPAPELTPAQRERLAQALARLFGERLAARERLVRRREGG